MSAKKSGRAPWCLCSFEMACPMCGRMERTPIAPGFFRCTSKVEVRNAGPGLSDPAAGPPVTVALIECGTEYQEGTGTGPPSCVCGTFAIGRCFLCVNPVCGEHSKLSSGRRLCSSCLAVEAEKDKAAAAAAAAAHGEERRLRRDRWLDSERRNLESAGAAERIVRVVGGLTVDSFGPPGQTDWPAVTDLLGDVGTADAPEWDLHAIVSWFCANAPGGPPNTIRRERKTVFGSWKSYLTPSWTFPGSSTLSFSFADSSTLNWCDLAVLSDGAVLTSGVPVSLYVGRSWVPVVGGRVQGTGQKINLSGHGLREVGRLLHVKFVTVPPA